MYTGWQKWVHVLQSRVQTILENIFINFINQKCVKKQKNKILRIYTEVQKWVHVHMYYIWYQVGYKHFYKVSKNTFVKQKVRKKTIAPVHCRAKVSTCASKSRTNYIKNIGE